MIATCSSKGASTNYKSTSNSSGIFGNSDRPEGCEYTEYCSVGGGEYWSIPSEYWSIKWIPKYSKWILKYSNWSMGPHIHLIQVEYWSIHTPLRPTYLLRCVDNYNNCKAFKNITTMCTEAWAPTYTWFKRHTEVFTPLCKVDVPCGRQTCWIEGLGLSGSFS